MKLFNHAKWYFVVSFALLLGLAGCDSEVSSPDSSSKSAGPKASSSKAQISEAQLSNVNEKAEELLAFAKKKGYDLNAANQKMNELIPYSSDGRKYHNSVKKAINPDDYQCGPTDFDDWASENLLYANLGDALTIILNDIDQYPFLYGLVFKDKESQPFQSYGYDGEYTRQIRRVSRTYNRFWRSVDLRSVQVLPAHGRILSDFDKVYAVVDVLYPSFSEASNKDFAQGIVDLVKASPDVYNGGDAPIFSANAVAYAGGSAIINGEPSPPKVLMGDGILDGQDAIGQGDAAPQAIVAHELGHQIQYELGDVFSDDPDSAESTRRTELMADAFAGYYLGHKRGAAFNWGRVESFLQADFNVGDCSFDSPSHHGTPNQRVNAGEFGFELANDGTRGYSIISASKFVDKFDNALPDIVAPDAD